MFFDPFRNALLYAAEELIKRAQEFLFGIEEGREAAAEGEIRLSEMRRRRELSFYKVLELTTHKVRAKQ